MDWSVLWILIGSLGVGVITLGLLGKYTGSSDLLTSVMSVVNILVNFVRTGISFILNNLPKPVKVFVVVVSVGLIGGWIYTFTLGMQYVCIPEQNGIGGQVYTTDSLFEGYIIRMWPDDLEGPPVGNVSLENTFGKPYAYDSERLSNLVDQVNDTDSGMTYYRFIGTDRKIINGGVSGYSQDDLSKISKLPANEQFLWFFGDKMGRFDVCMDWKALERYQDETSGSMTCILQKEDSTVNVLLNGANFYTGPAPNACFKGTVASLLFTFGADVPVGFVSNWSSPVGSIVYLYDEKNNVLKISGDSYDHAVNSYFGFGGYGMKNCKTASSELESIIGPPLYITVDGESIPIYNAGKDLFRVDSTTTGDNEYFIDTDLIEKSSAITENFKLYEKGDSALNYVCNPATKDKYDIKMEIGGNGRPGTGIDPFATSTLVVLFGGGLLISLYMFIKNL